MDRISILKKLYDLIVTDTMRSDETVNALR